MQEPCRSCAFREQDFGGCRCQALAIAGDAAATDPSCDLSPLHAKIQALAERAASEQGTEYAYRGRQGRKTATPIPVR
jgi:pyrroloquinoline quinone biosynthesis protein E